LNLALLEPIIDAGTAVPYQMHFGAWVTAAEAAVTKGASTVSVF